MAFALQRPTWIRPALLVLSSAVVLTPLQASRANDAVGTLKPPCPRIASPAGQSYLQPARLPASDVVAKNKLGCLSPADAVYGADGCPLRYCGNAAGTFQLPAP
ncbi:MAG: hypothetical protein VKM98_10810 [Cyanobacteriota bacterium]|nr:hypothetical protein [Cyanobacteriota bacterium]